MLNGFIFSINYYVKSKRNKNISEKKRKQTEKKEWFNGVVVCRPYYNILVT